MAKFFMGQLVSENPDYLVFIRDAKGDNFRHELYSEYKATRERMPDNLRDQLVDIETMIRAMNIDIIERTWFEADDLIGALAVDLGKDKNNEIYILSGDKDLYALIQDNVYIYDTMKKKIFQREETIEKFGVPPECVRDYLAICGDSSDNIPGISWIGPKKAEVLLKEFWSVDALYEAIDALGEIYETLSEEAQKILKGKTLEKFIAGRESAFLSQKLATLACDMDISDFKLEDFYFSSERIMTPAVQVFFREHEFFSLIWESKKELKTWKDTGLSVKVIATDEDLGTLEKSMVFVPEVVLDTETTSLDIQQAELVGVSLYLDEKNIYYINRMHGWSQVSDTALKSFIQRLLSSDKLIIGHNLKYDLEILETFLLTSSGKKTQWQETLF